MKGLLIDDDQLYASTLQRSLARKGITETVIAHESDAALALATTWQPDFVLLDLKLGNESGLSLIAPLRKRCPQARILLLTGYASVATAVEAIKRGADDYLPKPFEPRELLARIRAILRRKVDSPAPSSQTLRFGSLEIDRDARVVRVGDVPSELTSYQFDLLLALAERAGRVLTRDQIMEAVRGRELDAFDRSIDVHMGRIRAAIEADPKAPKRILTVRGVGYVFARQQD